MKVAELNKFFFYLILSVTLSSGCGKDLGDDPVDPVDPIKPLTPAEILARYKPIKEYAEEYVPGITVGLGLGADIYLKDSDYKKLSDENFQMFTTGNAMKHSSVVKADGTLNFSTIDAFLAAVPSDIEIYGHNFIWHTQQKQSYLKSLIAPEMEDGSGDGGVCRNVISNSGFESGIEGWIGFWGKYDYEIVQPGYESDKAIHFTIKPDCVNMWDAQLFWPLNSFLEKGVTYAYEFYAKSDSGLQVQFLGQNASYAGIYLETFTPGTDWTYCTGEFTFDGSVEELERIGIQFGGEAGSQLWIDNFRFGKKNDPSTSSVKALSGVTYKYKTPEEKKEILLGAMEDWIRQMAGHLGDRVKHWDVINEPITDWNHQWRGVNGNFSEGDSEPVEKDGLTLNWGADRWYWGYYIGKEYAVKAFEYARKYCGPDARLFVNDYGLESSPDKLKALIAFVEYIEQNGQKVDGIGTQMHVSTSITKAKVDAMFQTMARTGKLVRVTELDVQVGTASPTSNQLLAQAETYKMIVESYLANVPVAQQSGITVWTLSDNPAEHEYWLKGDSPNLFNKTYGRKISYKYFCDALAGKDIGAEF